MTQNKGRGMVLFVFALCTFVAIVTELLPSGLLPELVKILNVSNQDAGNLTSFYALAATFTGLPIVTATRFWDRKRIMTLAILGFLISNIVLGLVPVYKIAAIARLIGGVSAGMFWGTTAVYLTSLFDIQEQGRAMAIGMGGTTIGVSLGQPIFAYIGEKMGGNTAFVILAVLAVLALLLVLKSLPSVPGEDRAAGIKATEVLKDRNLQIIILITLLTVIANYGGYVYVALIIEEITFSGGIGRALLMFGIGSLIGVALSSKFADSKLRELFGSYLILTVLAMVIFYFIRTNEVLNHLAFLIWGAGFATLAILTQTAVTRRVHKSPGQGLAYQSAAYNFSIMIGSYVGGIIISTRPPIQVTLLTLVLVAIAAIITFAARGTFAPAE